MKLIPNLSAIDQKAIEDCGIPSLLLMEEAGAHVADKVLEILEEQEVDFHAAHVLVVCGRGNNAGDGFVAARRMSRYGVGAVSVLLTSEDDEYSEDAGINFPLLQWTRCTLLMAQEQEFLQEILESADLIVDALFGSGLSREIQDLEANIVQSINVASEKFDIPVLSIDLPSGLDAKSGQILGVAVKATHTLTLATGKPGLFLMPGKLYSGTVEVADIGIPEFLISEDPSPMRLMTPSQIVEWFPTRSLDAHKYSVGHVLVIAGSQNMPGAPALVTRAALMSGAGMVTLAAPDAVMVRSPLIPEIVRYSLPDDGRGVCLSQSVDALVELMESKRFNSIVLGPGLGVSAETLEFMKRFLQEAKQRFSGPIVMDADALNVLAQMPEYGLDERFILTPHVGEFRRLFSDIEQVENDWIGAVTEARKRFGCHVVLKSASTVIATCNGNVWVSPVGNPGMATAGSGDVLAGIIGGLAAQGLDPDVAAIVGVFLHGFSGDVALKSSTYSSLLASNIIDAIPTAIELLSQHEASEKSAS